MPTELAPLETSAKYREVYDAIKSPELQKRLHSLAHDDRIPSGVMRVWALKLLRWRAGDVDRFGTFVLYPVPPSDKVDMETILNVDRIVTRELLPEFRSRQWRSLRAGATYDGQAATA